jgi:hypothetical protein
MLGGATIHIVKQKANIKKTISEIEKEFCFIIKTYIEGVEF